MAGNIPYIGSKISLITTSDIRYEGILYTLNREESTIAVQNVRSFGTEGRRCPEVPMSNEIYDFIIFRGKDLKDLTVLQGAPEQRPPATSSHAGASEQYADQGNSAYSHSASQADQQSLQVGSHASMSAYQRQSLGSTAQAAGRNNGYPPATSASGSLPLTASSVGNSYGGAGAYASPTAGSSGSRSVDKGGSSPFGSGVAAATAAAAHSRQSYSSSEPPPPDSPYMGNTGIGAAQLQGRVPSPYEDGNGMSSSRANSEDAKGGVQRGLSGGVGVDSKDRMADAKDKGARGRGKGGAQKKPLFEVLRFHKRAEEIIVKMMRNQSSANLGPAELRAMSEMNPSVYHFYLDFVNYCCPSHMVQTDEQQWEMLCKALKKHFEKEFGANQNQKLPQPQRPNNTLGDFITIQTDTKAAKKNAKVTRGGGRVGGRGSGRGDKKDGTEAEGSGVEESPAQSSSWACPRCTLRNENLLLECAACGTSKQQAALWAEFPPLG